MNQNKSAEASPAMGDKNSTADQVRDNSADLASALEVRSDDHVQGNPNAPVTIIEYSDLQCPYCASFDKTMRQVMENYGDDVRWVYRHFPLSSIHPYARAAAEASECAAEQGKFWEYADNIFDNQSSLSQNYLSSAAEQVGLNTAQFEDCLSSGKYSSQVSADYQEGLSLGVTGTPTSFINGQKVPGTLTYQQMQSILDSLK
jgi:protein-disulfide isomerase